MPAIPPPPTTTRTSGIAITGFVLSFFCGLLGLIFSIIGYRECKKSAGKVTGEGLALAGIIVSVLTTAAAILMYVMFTRFIDQAEMMSKQRESRYELERMARGVKSHYIANGAFPTGSAPSTPLLKCCEHRGGKCNGNFSTPEWRQIDFESWGSTKFQYSYKSNAKEFVATAVGDFDCDGDEVVYRLYVTAEDGSPVSRIETVSDED